MSDFIEETSSTNYKLKAYSGSTDSDFAKALHIYTENIGATSLTDTNEIIYCLDNYSKHYKSSNFVVAGLYQNKLLIGYCQFIYIRDEKIIIIDYIAIDEKHRGLSVFYVFIEKIREFIYANGYEIKFLVGEVNIQNSQSNDIPIKAKSLVKLLKSNNFGEVKSLYFQPMLGVNNFESEQKSILMLYPANEYESIKKETFSKIIETIYFKHYERWYKIFLTENDFITYSKHLHDLFKKVSDKTTPIIAIEKDDYIYGEPVIDRTIIKKSKKGVLLFLGFLGILGILLSITLILKLRFDFEYKSQLYLFILVVFLYLLIISFFSQKAEKMLSKMWEKIIDKIN